MTETQSRAAEASYHHGNLRPVLITAGREMLEADGVRGFSLRALSRRAQVSHAAPVHYFKTLPVFLAACRDDGFRELADGLDAAIAASDGGAVDTLCAMAVAYLRFGKAYPVMLRLMFDRDTAPSSRGDPNTQSNRAYTQLQKAVRETMSDAASDNAAFDIRINAVWALIHGFVTLENEGQICRQAQPPLATERMLTIALVALLAHVDPETPIID